MKKLKFNVGDEAVMACEVGDLVKGEKVKVRQVDATNGAAFPYFCWSKESGFSSWMSADAIKPRKKPKYKRLQKQIDGLKKEVKALQGTNYMVTLESTLEPCPGTMDALNEATNIRPKQPTALKVGDIAVVLSDKDHNLIPGQAVRLVKSQPNGFECVLLAGGDPHLMLLSELKHINDFK